MCVCSYPLNREVDGGDVSKYLASSSLSSLHTHLTIDLVCVRMCVCGCVCVWVCVGVCGCVWVCVCGWVGGCGVGGWVWVGGCVHGSLHSQDSITTEERRNHKCLSQESLKVRVYRSQCIPTATYNVI